MRLPRKVMQELFEAKIKTLRAAITEANMGLKRAAFHGLERSRGVDLIRKPVGDKKERDRMLHVEEEVRWCSQANRSDGDW